MNPIEIGHAVSDLVEAPYGTREFPYSFLEALGRKATGAERLPTGDANKSDLDGVLQRNNLHIANRPPGRPRRPLPR
jgi:hypothetical protein